MKYSNGAAVRKETNVRKKMILMISISSALILSTLILSFALSDQNLRSNASAVNRPPSLCHLFGADWLGRDMFTRTVKGLRLSLAVGAFAGLISVVIATLLGVCAAVFGKAVDAIVSWFIDLFIGMPHIVFMILISFISGGGAQGIVIGVSVTHWTSLARIIRAEVLQIKNAEYIQIAKSYGKPLWFIAGKHILPAIFPQILIGFLLLFPHLILHEAAVTFLGFGFSPQTPAVGVILSEAMEHISTGKWWLALFPGLALVIVIKSFDSIGEQVRILMEPAIAHE
jgi:peptide/nickel transport system permease protein